MAFFCFAPQTTVMQVWTTRDLFNSTLLWTYLALSVNYLNSKQGHQYFLSHLSARQVRFPYALMLSKTRDAALCLLEAFSQPPQKHAGSFSRESVASHPCSATQPSPTAAACDHVSRWQLGKLCTVCLFMTRTQSWSAACNHGLEMYHVAMRASECAVYEKHSLRFMVTGNPSSCLKEPGDTKTTQVISRVLLSRSVHSLSVWCTVTVEASNGHTSIQIHRTANMSVHKHSSTNEHTQTPDLT